MYQFFKEQQVQVKHLVYFERIKKIIDKNKQALVLLPEIFLTNEFKSRFEDFFGYEPAIWHSKITPKNKRIIWKGIIENKIKLVVVLDQHYFYHLKS